MNNSKNTILKEAELLKDLLREKTGINFNLKMIYGIGEEVTGNDKKEDCIFSTYGTMQLSDDRVIDNHYIALDFTGYSDNDDLNDFESLLLYSLESYNELLYSDNLDNLLSDENIYDDILERMESIADYVHGDYTRYSNIILKSEYI